MKNKISIYKKTGILLIIAVVITAAAIMSIGRTFSMLFDAAEPVINDFDNAVMSCQVEEDFEGGGEVKRDVKINNTSNISGYIRVALIAKWHNKDSASSAGLSADGTYDITFADDYDSNWFLGTDGFYYAKNPIAPGESTPILIKTCSVSDQLSGDYDGKVFALHIAATIIQAENTNAASEAWPVQINSDKTISAK